MAGSQMRLGRTRPPRPMGKGWNSRARRARHASVVLVVVRRRARVGLGLGVHLVLDAVRPVRRRCRASKPRAVGRRALAEGLEDLLQPGHPPRELRRARRASARPRPASRLREGAAASPKRAQHLDQARAQAVRRLHQLALEQAVVHEAQRVLDVLVRASPRAAGPRRRAERTRPSAPSSAAAATSPHRSDDASHERRMHLSSVIP